MSNKREPDILKKGKEFHKLIQKEWLATAKDGVPKPEQSLTKLNGRRGRVDIFIDEIDKDFISIVEIKGTDWDRIKPANIRRNVKRHIRQLWGYIDSQLEGLGMSVCAGIIFPKLPRDYDRLKLIESMFEEEGIQVAWQNETLEHLRQRLG
jgi:hypothetical protein